MGLGKLCTPYKGVLVVPEGTQRLELVSKHACCKWWWVASQPTGQNS